MDSIGRVIREGLRFCAKILTMKRNHVKLSGDCLTAYMDTILQRGDNNVG